MIAVSREGGGQVDGLTNAQGGSCGINNGWGEIFFDKQIVCIEIGHPIYNERKVTRTQKSAVLDRVDLQRAVLRLSPESEDPVDDSSGIGLYPHVRIGATEIFNSDLGFPGVVNVGV